MLNACARSEVLTHKDLTMNHILINATHKEEIRVAIVKDKQLTDLNIETTLNRKTKGNIYKGKISRVEKSLEAAFVDYGKDRQGFLPFKEVADTLYSGTKPKGDKISISDVLKEGQEIIVQVEKEERGNKGAALSTYMNLAGAYMILTPNNPKSNGISRQIQSSDRQDLKGVISKMSIPKQSGLIIRTAGSGKNLEELQWEVDYLSELWESINSEASNREAPFLIYQESNIIVRTLRDYLRSDTDSVIFDDLDAFKQAKEFVGFVLPHYLDRVKFFDVSEHSLFSHMSIESQVRNVFNREVTLSSGATIVFDTAEALTAIDINSARATKGSDIEETAYNTNIDAAKEISRQLQLRDIGGLVVIDFIDMATEEHRKSIESIMEKATSSDRARIQIGTISQFGLLEMSRQRLMSSVTESVERTCPQCSGSGTTPTIPSLALTMLRKMEDGCNAAKHQTSRITVQSSVEVITYLLNEKRSNIDTLENKHGVRITLLPNPHMLFPNYTLTKQKEEKKSHHKSYQGISKSQQNLADNGLDVIEERPAISGNRPKSKIPEKEVSFFTKLSKLLFSENNTDSAPSPSSNNDNRNRNSNRNRNRNRNNPQNRQQAQKNNKSFNKDNESSSPNQSKQNRGNRAGPKSNSKPDNKNNESSKPSVINNTKDVVETELSSNSNTNSKADNKSVPRANNTKPKSSPKPKTDTKAKSTPKPKPKPKPKAKAKAKTYTNKDKSDIKVETAKKTENNIDKQESGAVATTE